MASASPAKIGLISSPVTFTGDSRPVRVDLERRQRVVFAVGEMARSSALPPLPSSKS